MSDSTPKDRLLQIARKIGEPGEPVVGSDPNGYFYVVEIKRAGGKWLRVQVSGAAGLAVACEAVTEAVKVLARSK
jgi:hypothetical protein